MKRWLYQHRVGLLLGLILALAALMRLYQLDSLPPGLHPDEAANGLDIFKILEEKDFQPFYERNGGRESLFFFLQSIGVTLFGNTIFGLRIVPALIGVASVAAVYLWTASWFRRRTALIAALLMAVTPWGVIISRDGFRAGMVALMIPLTLWLFTKAFQTKKNLWFILAGVSLGAGFYTYIAYRMFPLALGAMLVFVFLWRRKWLRQWWRKVAIALAAMTVVLIPLGLYAIENPNDIAGRPGGVSVFNPDLNKGDLIGTLADTTAKTALMFNVRGDENYRHNMGGEPQFNIFVGAMFLLGIFVAIARIKRLHYFGLLMVFGAMLLPAVLTAEGIPHALRSIGALAPGLVLAAVGINYLLNRWQAVFPLNSVARGSGVGAVILLLLLSVYHGYATYFAAWANAPETYKSYSEENVALAEHYNTTPPKGARYAIGGGYTLQTVEYLTHKKSQYTRIDPTEVDSIPLEPGQAKEFAVFSYEKDKLLSRLQLKFPDGKVSPYYSSFSGDELFILYNVPAK